MGVTDYRVVIPAAGGGRRLGGSIRKQYLHIGGRTVLEHAIHAVLDHEAAAGVVVVISPDDKLWPELNHRLTAPVESVSGGATRARSVLAGLNHLARGCGDDQLVLVHDAARPCLNRKDLAKLVEVAANDDAGALLAVTMTDTVKRVADGRVCETLNRDTLVRAVTPQAFRLGVLKAAVQEALDRGVDPTDECAAMEMAGHRPCVVTGSSDNIKVTFPDDLDHAEQILARRRSGS